MANRSSMTYLQRTMIVVPCVRHCARFTSCGLKSHIRPVVPVGGLLGRDRPDFRPVTVEMRKRAAFRAVTEPLRNQFQCPTCGCRGEPCSRTPSRCCH